MNLKTLKKKKLIVIFSDGSFLFSKNSFFKKILFFDKDDRNSSLWIKLKKLPNQSKLNKLNYKNKFLK